MADDQIWITIELSDPRRSDEELQATADNLRSEIREVEGIAEVGFISVEQAPPDSKGIGGFLIGQLQALVNLKNLKTLVQTLGRSTFGTTIKVKAEGNGRKLEVEMSCPEDFEKILPQVKSFIDG